MFPAVILDQRHDFARHRPATDNQRRWTLLHND